MVLTNICSKCNDVHVILPNITLSLKEVHLPFPLFFPKKKKNKKKEGKLPSLLPLLILLLNPAILFLCMTTQLKERASKKLLNLSNSSKMPSKSKKHSKAASSSSSPSISSSPSPYRTPNPDTEFNEDDCLGALEEASRKFPTLISKSAFIGKVSADASTSTSALDALDSKVCKIWLSESAMVASSITPGSVVSVILFSNFIIRHYKFVEVADASMCKLYAFGLKFVQRWSLYISYASFILS